MRAIWDFATCNLFELDRRFRDLLQRDYIALYPRGLSPSYSLPLQREISVIVRRSLLRKAKEGYDYVTVQHNDLFCALFALVGP
jgi:hypothetical protein